MNPIDRKPLKERAKELIRTAQPPAWQVTLIFLLATTWVSTVVDLFNPVTRAIQEWYQTVYPAAVSGDLGVVYSAQAAFGRLLTSSTGYVSMLLSVIISLYITVVDYGYNSYSLGVVRLQNPDQSELFSRFYMAGKIILAEILQVVFATLWALPAALIGGILAGITDSIVLFTLIGTIAGTVLCLMAIYRYRMIVYALLDDPEISVLEAFRRSEALMKGRKWELFVLDLSFLGWIILAGAVSNLVGGILPGVVGTLAGTAVATACYCFLQPYQSFTYAQWYEAIRPQAEAQPEETAPF